MLYLVANSNKISAVFCRAKSKESSCMRWRGAEQGSSKMYGRQQVQEESIYNLIPKTPEKPPKSERYDLDFKKYTTQSVDGWGRGGGVEPSKRGASDLITFREGLLGKR